MKKLILILAKFATYIFHTEKIKLCSDDRFMNCHLKLPSNLEGLVIMKSTAFVGPIHPYFNVVFIHGSSLGIRYMFVYVFV